LLAVSFEKQESPIEKSGFLVLSVRVFQIQRFGQKMLKTLIV
jgi:hypothetical protein